MTSRYSLVVIVVTAATLAVQDSDGSRERRRQSDEERLLSQLFTDYNHFARPLIDSSDTVNVTLKFCLMHIKDLDIRSQIFTTTGLLVLEWKDERLTWLPSEHNGMKEVIVEARRLWKPELVVINGAEKLYEEYNQFRAVISHEGLVHWEPAGVFKTMCEIDITYYPFDEQRCELKIGSWSYNTDKMNLSTSKDINLDSYTLNGEWEVLGTTAERQEFSAGLVPTERFSSVAFAIQLRRRHLFYVINVIMPSVMTSVLLLSVFFCTPAQKVQIGVVVLLSFRIFLLNVAGNIPKTSDHVPLLVIYLTCTLVITTLSMVLTVLVLNLYGTADHPVPIWMRDFVLIFVARTLGMCDMARIYQDAKDAAARQARRSRPRHWAGLGFFVRTALTGRHQPREEEEGTTILEMQGRQVTTDMVAAANDSDPASLLCAQTASDSPQCNSTPAKSTTTTETFDKEPDKPPDYSKDWKRVAEIVDRLFFWLFLLAFALPTLVLFHPLMTLISHQRHR